MSIESGALIVAVVSSGLAAVLVRAASRRMAWTLGLAAPFAVASVLYWLPSWTGSDATEFRTWAPVFIVPWGLLGAIASAVVIA